MLTFNAERFRKLNSITKYPSILTYHSIGKGGTLEETLIHNLVNQELEATEKVDGTNTRIVFIGDSDYYIGSREELIYARHDRVANDITVPTGKIIPIAEEIIISGKLDPTKLTVVYLESYGGKITKAWKQYAMSSNDYGFKVFDIFTMDIEQLLERLDTMKLESISTWRDKGGQYFVERTTVLEFVNNLSITAVPLVGTFKCDELPITIQGMYNFLSSFKDTKVGVTNHGKAEGIVVRTSDRSVIFKIRFEDYEKTLRKLGGL